MLVPKLRVPERDEHVAEQRRVVSAIGRADRQVGEERVELDAAHRTLDREVVPVTVLDEPGRKRARAISLDLSDDSGVEAVDTRVADLERADAAPRVLRAFERNSDLVRRRAALREGDAADPGVQEVLRLRGDPVEMGKRLLHATSARNEVGIETDQPPEQEALCRSS